MSAHPLSRSLEPVPPSEDALACDACAPLVAELRERVARLERESMVDSLTGAWNRRYLDRCIAAEARRGRRHRLALSAALLDVDGLDAVNAAHGRHAGEAVLQEVVAVLRPALRASDVVGRWGGDLVMVLMPSTSHAGAAAVAAKLRAAVAEHAFSLGRAITLSAGVGEILANETPADFAGRVEAALRRARAGGRDRVEAEAGGASDGWAREDASSIVRLVWQDSYGCGERHIDADHRELFERANALVSLSLRPETTGTELVAAMDRCFKHIAAHFAQEEDILARSGFAGLDGHRVAHRVLLARAAALRRAAQEGDAGFGELVEFLVREVVARHVLTADREFFELFAASES